MAAIVGERSGMRRLDWACAWRAKRGDEKANKHRKKPKRGRHTRNHLSARPPVCTRPHHPKEIYFPCYHSDARHAKETAAWDYVWSLTANRTMEGRAGALGAPQTSRYFVFMT